MVTERHFYCAGCGSTYNFSQFFGPNVNVTCKMCQTPCTEETKVAAEVKQETFARAVEAEAVERLKAQPKEEPKLEPVDVENPVLDMGAGL